MEAIAKIENVRISPRKARLLAAVIKKMPVDKALAQLSLMTKHGSKEFLVLLKSAMANAANNLKLKKEDLVISNILVDEGLKMKRRDTSHGQRFGGGVIVKKTSHIRVILSDMGNEPSRSKSAQSLAYKQAYGK